MPATAQADGHQFLCPDGKLIHAANVCRKVKQEDRAAEIGCMSNARRERQGHVMLTEVF